MEDDQEVARLKSQVLGLHKNGSKFFCRLGMIVWLKIGPRNGPSFWFFEIFSPEWSQILVFKNGFPRMVHILVLRFPQNSPK